MSRNFLLTFALCAPIATTFAQRISIRFDNATTVEPTLSVAKLKYNKDFAYSFTLDDAREDAYRVALPFFEGGVFATRYYPPLQYTDGCGNSLSFKGGVAWNTANHFGADAHTGTTPGLLTWWHLDSLYRVGWDVLNHSYSHKARSSHSMDWQTYKDEVDKNNVVVEQRTASKIRMSLFVVPSGDTNYYQAALNSGHQVVFDQNYRLTGFRGLQVDADIPLHPMKIHRQLMEESVGRFNFLDEIAQKSTNGNHYWYNEFTHRLDDLSVGGAKFNLFKQHLRNVAARYGKNGADKMWMAPLQEVYEYLITRQTIQYQTQWTNSELVLDFNLWNIPAWVRRKTVTLVVNSYWNFSRVDVPAGVKVTFKGYGAKKLINLDFSNWQSNSVVRQEAVHSKAQVYPNPVEDVLLIELLGESGEWALEVYDNTSKLMLQQSVQMPFAPLDVSQLSAGAYYVVLRQGSNVYRHSFIKMAP